MTGLVHVYHGDGKGKTTAAVGLAVRALGSGMPVRFCQFLKSGDSCETVLLDSLCRTAPVEVRCDGTSGFVFSMSDSERQQLSASQHSLLAWAFEQQQGLLVLDELLDAVGLGLVAHETVLSLLQSRSKALEVVITGRNPPPELLELADYVTEMRKIKHPYDKGQTARRGIEQ